MKRLALTAALALSTAACNTVAPPAAAPAYTPPAPVSAPPTPIAPFVVYQTAAKLDAAWLATQRLYLAAAPHLDRATKDKLKPLLATGQKAVEAADAASDATSFAQAAAVAGGIIDTICASIGAKP